MLSQTARLQRHRVRLERLHGCRTREGHDTCHQLEPERKKKHRLVRALYRQRYLVEVFFHNLKRFRAIATRYEKTARNYLALVQVACAWLWLKGKPLAAPEDENAAS